MNEHNHHSIREVIRVRIAAGEWPPDSLMPTEADLAREYGCSRSTVNRALQTLASDGLIERKRRAGTRVKELPVRCAKFKIPLIRHEVEAAGGRYDHHLILREIAVAPDYVLMRLRLARGARALHLQTAHLCNARTYAFEDRWINVDAAPAILEAPLDLVSANEWLLRQVPYSSGDVMFSAHVAGAREAEALEAPVGSALFAVERTTWFEDQYITTTKLFYRPGHQLRAQL